MKPSVWFAAIVVAFLIWAALVLAKGVGAGDPSETLTGSEPPPPPPADTTAKDDTIRHLEGELHASRRARARERSASRRALHRIIHSPVYGTSTIEKSFLCIHSYEGAWNDPSAPYWGGLQMDVGFMRTYAPWALRIWGTADHWPIVVQMAAAIEAWTSRGFGPWPNTSRACGLR